MRTQTRQEHEQRIEQAVKLIHAGLDEPLDPAALADAICLSRFHFHRVFVALTGETVGDMSRRLRLERSAQQLRNREASITNIAFDAGYATHEAFVKAFRQAFGYAPSEFRDRLSYDGLLPTPNGLHYGDPNLRSFRFPPHKRNLTMNIETREMPALKAMCIPHKGPYFMIGQTFGRLGGLVCQHQANVGLGIAFYYDDPQSVPADQLRSDAGFLIEGLVPFEHLDLHEVEVPGGRFAVATYVGPYDGLNSAWQEFYAEWFPTSGEQFGEAPPFELYLDDCTKAEPEKLRTELYISLAPRPAAVASV